MARQSLLASISSSMRIDRKKGDLVVGSIPEKFWCSEIDKFINGIAADHCRGNTSNTNGSLLEDFPKQSNLMWQCDCPKSGFLVRRDNLLHESQTRVQDGNDRYSEFFHVDPLRRRVPQIRNTVLFWLRSVIFVPSSPMESLKEFYCKRYSSQILNQC